MRSTLSTASWIDSKVGNDLPVERDLGTGQWVPKVSERAENSVGGTFCYDFSSQK